MDAWVKITEDDRPYLVFDADGVSVNTTTTCSTVIGGIRYAYVPDGAKLRFADGSEEG